MMRYQDWDRSIQLCDEQEYIPGRSAFVSLRRFSWRPHVVRLSVGKEEQFRRITSRRHSTKRWRVFMAGRRGDVPSASRQTRHNEVSPGSSSWLPLFEGRKVATEPQQSHDVAEKKYGRKARHDCVLMRSVLSGKFNARVACNWSWAMHRETCRTLRTDKCVFCCISGAVIRGRDLYGSPAASRLSPPADMITAIGLTRRRRRSFGLITADHSKGFQADFLTAKYSSGFFCGMMKLGIVDNSAGIAPKIRRSNAPRL